MRYFTPTRLVPTRSLPAATLAGIALATSILATASPATAADLDTGYPDIPAALPQQTVTFGSGWYIRGDIAVTRLPNVKTTQANTSSAPDLTIGSGSQVGYTASAGGGYSFNRYLRGDVVFDYHQPIHSATRGGDISCLTGYNKGRIVGYTTTTSATGSVTTPEYEYTPFYNTCHGVNDAKIQSYDVLVNGYVDIGTWYNVTPYVGAGVGLAFGHFSTASHYYQGDGTSYDFNITDPNTGSSYRYYYDQTRSGMYYNFAFALMAGVAIDVYDHVKLDIGYRYLNQGKVLGADLTQHEIRAGLRYMIDN